MLNILRVPILNTDSYFISNLVNFKWTLETGENGSSYCTELF